MVPERLRRFRRDEGSALVLVLAFLAAFAVLVVALLDKAYANVATSSVVRDQQQRVAAANAGLEYGITKVRSDSTLCPIEGTTGVLPPLTSNGRTVTVTCTATYGSALGPGGWALFVASPSGKVATQSGAAVTKMVEGGLYNAGTWNLLAPLEVESAPVVWNRPLGCAKPGNLTVSGFYGWHCAPAALPVPAPPQSFAELQAGLADALPPAAPAPTTAGSCRTFYPGTYTSAPALAAQNYFTSGVYVLDNVGVWEINDLLIAGQPAPGEIRRLAPVPACATADPAGTPASGAVFILAGNSAIRVKLGKAELFSRPLNGRSGSSIHQVSGAEGPAWAAKASTVGLGSPIVEVGNGSGVQLSVHGAIYAPSALVRLRATNTAVATAEGGVVAGSVELDASASIGPNALLVSNGVGSGGRVLRLESTVTPIGGEKTLSASAVVSIANDGAATTSVSSWHVNNP